MLSPSSQHYLFNKLARIKAEATLSLSPSLLWTNAFPLHPPSWPPLPLPSQLQCGLSCHRKKPPAADRVLMADPYLGDTVSGKNIATDNDHLLLDKCQGLSPDGCCAKKISITHHRLAGLLWHSPHQGARTLWRTEPWNPESSLYPNASCLG